MNLKLLSKQEESRWVFLEQNLKHLEMLRKKGTKKMFSCVERFGKSRGRRAQSVSPAPDSCCSSESVRLEIIIMNVKSWCWEGDGLGGLRKCSIPGDIAHHTGMMCEKCECGKAALASVFLCALVYDSNSTLIFLWQFFMLGV